MSVSIRPLDLPYLYIIMMLFLGLKRTELPSAPLGGW